jgi:rod shape determining protein RodA
MLNIKTQVIKNIDWMLVVVVLVLVSISLSAIYSVDLSKGSTLDYFPTQFIALLIGLVAMSVAAFVHVSFYRNSAKLIYIAALALLVLVLFFGITVRGTTGWFRLAGFSFQPAEFAKVALVIFMAWLISRYGRRFDKPQFVVATGLFTLILAGLIMLQPDLGSALVLGGVWFGMLFLTGTKKRYIAGLIGIFVVVSIFSWVFVFKDYQKDRILTFVDPARDPLGSGYNVMQSVIAIGSGNFFGRGLGFGSQSQLHFLPEAQTDFIFSVIGEELGFLGTAVLLILYFIILWRLLRIARQSQDDFRAYLVLGILLLFLVQMIVNIGGATGFLPVTGVTLPFVSYGGSSLVINLLLIGIALSAARS